VTFGHLLILDNDDDDVNEDIDKAKVESIEDEFQTFSNVDFTETLKFNMQKLHSDYIQNTSKYSNYSVYSHVQETAKGKTISLVPVMISRLEHYHHCYYSTSTATPIDEKDEDNDNVGEERRISLSISDNAYIDNGARPSLKGMVIPVYELKTSSCGKVFKRRRHHLSRL